MCANWTHIPVVIDTTNEHSKFSWRTGSIHVYDGVDIIPPWLQKYWCKPINKPVSLFDEPLTLKWVDSKTILT